MEGDWFDHFFVPNQRQDRIHIGWVPFLFPELVSHWPRDQLWHQVIAIIFIHWLRGQNTKQKSGVAHFQGEKCSYWCEV